jgi:hypothetical protein
MPDVASYATAYPMAPYAGLFILPVGLCILLGAFTPPNYRTPLVGAGFALGVLAICLLGSHLGHPRANGTRLQLISLAAAITFEVAAFVLVMPRLSDRTGRPALLATLIIVGAHFLIMTPAFGPLIFWLGIACLINAACGWRWRCLCPAWLWGIDGGLKLAFATLLLLTAPSLT